MEKFKQSLCGTVTGLANATDTIIPGLKITAPRSGTYLIRGRSELVIAATDTAQTISAGVIRIYKNGVYMGANWNCSAGLALYSTNANRIGVAVTENKMYLQEGDYIDLYAAIDAAGGTVTTRDAYCSIVVEEI